MIDINKLTPGKRYVVTFDDCCVQGILSGVFGHYENPDDDEELNAYSGAVFDFGLVSGHGWDAEDVV